MATPALRIRIAPKFPTKIQGSGGISVTRTGGVVTIGGAALRPYPSVTAASASKIDLATEAVRVDGWGMPGDGGAALYKRVNLEPTHAGKFQDANGAWFELAVPAVSPEMIGGNVQASMLVASALGARWVAAPKTYTVSTLTIPDGLEIQAAGATIARVGTLSARSSFIVIGKNVTADSLAFTFDGTETGSIASAALVRIDDDFTCGPMFLKADTQIGYAQSLNAVIATGVRTRIERAYFENLDYWLCLLNPSVTDIATGSEIGVISGKSYMRPFYGQFCSFKLAGIYAIGRSPHADLIPAPGRYQSNLYEGCADYVVGDVYMEDCGHGMRIGGSPHANAVTRNAKYGRHYIVRPRGGGFKINPSRLASPGVTEKAYNIDCAGVYVIDGGDGGAEGNRDLLRVSHVRGFHCAYAYAAIQNDATSCEYGLIINDSQDVSIDELGGDNLNAGLVHLNGNNDCDGINQFGGDVYRLNIGRLTGKAAGSNLIAISNDPLITPTFNYGDIYINCAGPSLTTRLFGRFDTNVLNGEFRIVGRISGSVAPIYLNFPVDDRFYTDIEWSGRRFQGRPDASRFLASLEIDGQRLDIAAAPASGQYGGLAIGNLRATAGDQAIGGSLVLHRPGANRRAAAIGALQFGATAQNTGLAVWTSGAGTGSSDQLARHSMFRPDGHMELALSVNKGVIMQSPDGTRYLLRIANGGTVAISAAPT